MVRQKKQVFISVIVVTLLLILFSFWYKEKYSMDVANHFVLNENGTKTLLIATQGSKFKDSLTNTIVAHYREFEYLKIEVIDVSTLPSKKITDYNAVIIIHTWEIWKAPEVVENFVRANVKYKEKLVLDATSGDGFYKLQGIDGLCGASLLEEVPKHSEEIIKRVNNLLIDE